MDDKLYLGIDYGTSNIKAAFYKKNRPAAAKIDGTKVCIPNVICRTKNKKANSNYEYFIGSEAVNQMKVGVPGFRDVKRYFVRADYTPLFDGNEPVTADELAAETFRWIIDGITANRSKKIEDIGGIVLTVPVCYGERQRRRLIRAAQAAGVSVTGVVPEPAASIFSFDEYNDFLEDHERRRVLVIDVGGGTTDLALAEMYYKKSEDSCCVEIKSSKGIDFGGNIITNIMIDEIFIPEIGREEYEKNKYLVFEAAEKAKTSAFIMEDDVSANVVISNGVLKEISVTYEKLLKILRGTGINEALKDTLDKMLNDAELSQEDIDKVYFIGGGIFIGELRQCIEKYFSIKLEVPDDDDDEMMTTVARGAVELARIFAGNENNVVIRQTIPYHIVSGNTTYMRADSFYDLPGRMCRIQSETLPDGSRGMRFYLVGKDNDSTAEDNRVYLGCFRFDGTPYDDAEYLELTLRKDGEILGTFYNENQDCLGQYPMDLED